jgi:FkbH-like protein
MNSIAKMSQKDKTVKCIVWDLDNTIWNGVLLENDKIILRNDVVETIKVLDKRGILQSIASKNDFSSAMEMLKKLGIEMYFLYPQINWGSKVASIEKIAKTINIGMDTLAFVDDDPFERGEVAFSLPDVICIDASDTTKMIDMPEMQPRFITEDSRHRRSMYLNDIKRSRIEQKFQGAQDEFLSSLEMKLYVRRARKEDIKRAEELTVRTNQLNSTGYTYSYDELNNLRKSDDHILLVSGLEDKYGTYGKIGLALIEIDRKIWNIKLLLMSCRVMSRGVGSILINVIREEARKKGVRLFAEMIQNDKNRQMYITYRFTNFKEKEKQNGKIILENDLTQIQTLQPYVKLETKL